tara:strand:+ start:109 stop:435 length:327 start_codon:yes stop_codon:yes gene_type:complete
MIKNKRVPGGEKNINSNKRWNEDELKEVFNLYLHLRKKSKYGHPKIHETVPEIIKLGKLLNRTTRSVESQLLMFRALEKFGEYGRKNMNSLCRKIWRQYSENIERFDQ